MDPKELAYIKLECFKIAAGLNHPTSTVDTLIKAAKAIEQEILS